MSRLSRIMDELINRIPRRLSGRAMWRCLERKPHRTIRNIGREVEELESRDVPSLLGQQLFPSNYPINQNIANAPVATNSAAIISHIGTSIKVHPDLGYDGQNPAYASGPLYGIPFNVVHGNSVSKVNVIIDGYPSESDILPVPIPANAVIGGDYQDGPNLNGPGYNSGQRGDSQLIIWDEDNNIAYELFGASRPNDVTNTTGQWEATSETVWYMNTDQFRTLGETSADAAGDSILAGLLRPDEALPVSQGGQGAIDHALRFTLPSQDINPQYIYPASHEINVSSQSSTSLPLGARLRLENTPAVDALIAKMGPEAQIAATAMQQYGLILADDGSSMYVTGSSASVDANNNISLTWDVNDILGLESLTAGDFQVVNLTPIVTGLSESSGAAGNTVTITGQNFSGAAGNLSVFFGTTAATSVTFVSDTEITAVVPSGSGTVNVTVQSGIVESGSNSSSNAASPVFGYGTSTTLSADQFTYGSGQTISGSNSTVSFASSSDVSGSGDIVTIVVEDTTGKAVSGLANSVFVLSLSGGKSTGTFGTVTETSTPGTYTTTFTGSTAGTASALTATVGGVQLNNQPTVQVTPGAVNASKSTVSFASSSDASGTNDVATIVVEDASGNAITGLANSAFAFSLTGGTGTGTFGSVTETSTLGTYTASFTGVLAGTADTLALKVNTVALTGQPKVTVTPGSVGGGNSSVSFSSSTVTSGQTDTVTIVVKDAAGNAITGLANSAFAFSLGSGTSTGTFGTVTETATHGTYTATFTGVLSGTASTLTATVSGVQLTSQPQVTVTVGSVSGTKSTVSFASGTDQSGTSDTATIVVEDAAGNAITGLASSAFAFSLGSGTSTGTFGTVTETATHGTYTASFTGTTAGTASTLTLKVNSVQLTSQPQVTVTSGGVAFLSVSGPSAATAGKSFSETVEALYPNGTVDTGYTGTIHFTSSDTQAGLPANYTFISSDDGVHTFTITLKTAGSQTITATDTSSSSITGNASVSVAAGAVASLTASGSGTATAGNFFNETVNAVDAYGNLVTGYTGTIHFSSSDAAAVLPANYTFVASDKGSHYFHIYMKTAGNQTVTVADTNNSSLQAVHSVIVYAAAAASLSVSGPSTATSGTSFTETVEAVDAYGNVATTYRGTVNFTSSDAAAALPANYTFVSSDNGSHTFTVTLKTAGNQTVTTTDTNNSSLHSSLSVTVSSGAASSLSVSGPSTATAGKSFSETVEALYPNGTVDTGYTGTIHFTSSDTQAGLPANYTFISSDDGVHTFTITLKTAGSQTITATDTSSSSITGNASVSVAAGAVASLTASGSGTATAGNFFNETVNAVDAYGNLVTGYTGTIHFSSSDAAAVLPANYTFVASDKGSHYFHIYMKTAGNQTVTVADTNNSSLQAVHSVIVYAAAAASLSVSGPSTATSGTSFTETVEAVDAYGNVATTYRGTVNFTSSDAAAALPANYTFTSGDNGVHTFTVTLMTPGSQTVTVTDTTKSSIDGTTSVNVQG